MTADCYRELLLRVMLMHLVISSLLSIPAYSLRIFVIRFSINPITVPDTINYVKNIKNVGSITNQEPSYGTPRPSTCTFSGIIFAINRDRKLANDTGKGGFRKEPRRIVSLICSSPLSNAASLPLSSRVLRRLRRFVSTAMPDTMEIHLTWTINRP